MSPFKAYLIEEKEGRVESGFTTMAVAQTRSGRSSDPRRLLKLQLQGCAGGNRSGIHCCPGQRARKRGRSVRTIWPAI